MNPSRVQDRIKKQIATLGVSPSFRLETFNYLLIFGEWLKEHATANNFETGYALYQYLNHEIIGDAAIDYLEFGVYNGYSFKTWLALHSHPNSRFFGFDSFEGLPEDWQMFSQVLPKGTFDMGGTPPVVKDARATFIKGIFQESLPRFLKHFTPQNRLFIHCDADLYSSTLYVLTTLHPILAPGTILLFDQFSSVTHEFRAFRDYTQAFMRTYKVLGACEPFYAKVAIALT